MPPDPVCRSTAFRIGSISKLLTGATLLRLDDAGVVGLDDDVRDYATAFQSQSRPVSLAQLAGHTGGIRHYRGGEYFNTRRYPTVASALDVFARDSLLSEPGTEYTYSSYGYNLLGAALATAGGAPYHDVVGNRVLAPLGLTHTLPEWLATAAVGSEGDATGTRLRLATPYSASGDSIAPSPPFDSSDRVPSGGWVATAEDVASLGFSVTAPGFLSAGSRERMLRSQRLHDGTETGYSFGLRLGRDSAGRRIAHHGGTSIGARAFLLIYPDAGLALSLLANGPADFDESSLAPIAAEFLR